MRARTSCWKESVCPLNWCISAWKPFCSLSWTSRTSAVCPTGAIPASLDSILWSHASSSRRFCSKFSSFLCMLRSRDFTAFSRYLCQQQHARSLIKATFHWIKIAFRPVCSVCSYYITTITTWAYRSMFTRIFEVNDRAPVANLHPRIDFARITHHSSFDSNAQILAEGY